MKKKGHIKISLFFILIMLCGLSIFFFNYRYIIEKIKRKKIYNSEVYDKIIKKIAKRHSVDPCLIKAVIWKESRFDSEIVGSKGEIGLMQIRMETAVADWSREKKTRIPCKGLLFCPNLNIEIGTWYLARALKYWRKRCGRDFYVAALCEYNAGRSNVKKWSTNLKGDDIIKNIPYLQTKKYVVSILKKYKEYKKSEWKNYE